MIERAEGKKDLRSRSRLGRVGVGSGVCPGAKGHEKERERNSKISIKERFWRMKTNLNIM